MGGKMVWASQQAVPRLAMSRMVGVRATLSESGRRPSIETTTTIGGGGGVGWVLGGVGERGATADPQAIAQAAARTASAAPILLDLRRLRAPDGSPRLTTPTSSSSP